MKIKDLTITFVLRDRQDVTETVSGDFRAIKRLAKAHRYAYPDLLDIRLHFDEDHFEENNPMKKVVVGDWTVKYNPLYSRPFQCWYNGNCMEEFKSQFQAVKHCIEQFLYGQ